MKIYSFLKKGKWNTLNSVCIIAANNKKEAINFFKEELNIEISNFDVSEFDEEYLKNNCTYLVENWDIYGDAKNLAKEIDKLADNIYKISEEITKENYLNRVLIIQNYCGLLQKVAESLGIFYV